VRSDLVFSGGCDAATMRSMRQLESIPAQLLEIPEPPKMLWVEGQLPDIEVFRYLTVIGSRKFSNYGRDACEHLLSGLSGYPIAIVSGLALGMDTIAHETALSLDLLTVAIPGSGLDPSVIYPASNRNLANRIVERGGALLSEFSPSQKSAVWTFPRRNRIMAGLSHATLIIEAGEKSGTLITAKLALDYNREVMVVPGNIFSHASKGSNRLMRDGAMPVAWGGDVLEALGLERSPQSTMEPPQLSSSEERVWRAIENPMGRDELLQMLSMPVNEANTLLMTMELKGLIKETMGDVRRAI